MWQPSGLPSSVATLARNFDDAMPTDEVIPPVTSETSAFSSAASSLESGRG